VPGRIERCHPPITRADLRRRKFFHRRAERIAERHAVEESADAAAK
jgi:hypothetical protein